MKRLLNTVNYPQDIKKLSISQLNRLAMELRVFLLENVSKTGGHLASNLGVVELTLAMHCCFDAPKDKIVWDVGHQAYVHKILTGRKEEFSTLRQFGGVSGFPKPCESEYDSFTEGHSSTSISQALGFACARDLAKTDERVVAVIGDGSLTGGVAYEALNNAGRLKSNMIVILNDNQMSISSNVGAISKHLNEIRTDKAYLETKGGVKEFISRLPVGEPVVNSIQRTKKRIKYMLIPGVMFEELGFKYIGPADGHNIEELISILNRAKKIEGPVLIHVRTVKGKGYKYAEKNPSAFHGVDKFDLKTGKPVDLRKTTYSDVFGRTINKLAEKDKSIVGISAAMVNGTGLNKFAMNYPNRFFDVGIAEQHAVSFAAAMAKSGFKPVFAVYSTFLQRAYDEIIEDVCLQNLNVLFAIDRAGIVGGDGETHQGLYDLSYLGHMPNMTLMMPRNGQELEKMLEFGLNEIDGPVAIRYPKDEAKESFDEPVSEIKFGKGEFIRDGNEIAILICGSMSVEIRQVCDMLENDGLNPMIINMRFAKPIDEALILEAAKKCKYIFTAEENTYNGGIGQRVLSVLSENDCLKDTNFHAFALPDKFIEHGTRDELKRKYSMDSKSIYDIIKERIEKNV